MARKRCNAIKKAGWDRMERKGRSGRVSFELFAFFVGTLRYGVRDSGGGGDCSDEADAFGRRRVDILWRGSFDC